MGGAYFLACFGVALAVLLWARGLGRLVPPLALVCGAVYGVRRFVQLVRAPVDVDDRPSR